MIKNIFRKVGTIVENRYRWVMLVSALLIVVALVGAQNIEMESGTETMISTDSQTYKDYDRFNRNFGSDVVVIMVGDDNLPQLLQPQNLKAFEFVRQDMGDASKYPDILSVIGPALLIQEAMGTDTLEVEDTQAVLATVINPDTGQIRPSFARVLPDEQHALISIVLKSNLETDTFRDLLKDIEQSVEAAAFANGDEVIITGVSTAMSELEDLMMSNLSLMFLFAIVLLVLVLAVIFKVRGIFLWRWLPLGVVLVGTIYTFGIMGFLGVGLSMITMAVFPILIGLGIDYGIQVHNRYDEESSKGRFGADAIIDSITHIGPAIGVALVAGCLGFAALFFSPIPMIQDFGLLLIVGVIASYLVAMFPLATFLYAKDRHNHQRTNSSHQGSNKPQNDTGTMEKALARMAPWVINNPFIILPIAIALTVGGLFADSHIETGTDETVFIDENMEPMRKLMTLREVAGGTAIVNLLFESPTGVATPAILNWMDEFETDIADPESGYQETVVAIGSIAQIVKQQNNGVIPQADEAITEILDSLPVSMRKNLISDDGSAANLTITLTQMSDSEMGKTVDRLREAMQSLEKPEGSQVSITGEPLVRLKVIDAVTHGRQQMTFLGLGFIFVGLVLLFRLRPIRALLATLPVLLIIGWSALVMYLMGIDFTPLTATLGALIMGVGVEYTILVMSRYYEEREKGILPIEAMTTALTKIGRAITVSAWTTMGGFAALLIAQDFPILQDFGIVTLINVFFALIVSMVVLPSLIVKVDTVAADHPILSRL